MKITKANTLRFSAILGTALVLGGSLAGCSAIENFQKSAADAWQVTYELSVDSTDAAALSNVSYSDQKTRTDKRATVDAGTISLAAKAGSNATWTVDSLAVVGDQADISATAAAGQTATCRILLDGEREIAKETGTPGGTVNCAAKAPEFGK